MLYYRHLSSLEHDPSGVEPEHPDVPARIEAIEAAMEGVGWPGCEVRQAPAATEDELALVHSIQHIGPIRALCAQGREKIDGDTFVDESSYRAALHAAGAHARWCERS